MGNKICGKMFETKHKLKLHQDEDHYGLLPVKRITPQKTVKNRYGPPELFTGQQIKHIPAGLNRFTKHTPPAKFNKNSEIKIPPTPVNEPLTVRAKSIHFSKKITMVLSEKIPCHICKENTVIRNYSNHLFERHNAKGGIY